MQAEMGGDRMRTGAARPTRWIPAEVWQRQGMTAQVLTLPGGNSFTLSIISKINWCQLFGYGSRAVGIMTPIEFTKPFRRKSHLKYLFISYCRCCHTDQFGRKIKHCSEGGSKGNGFEVAERNLYAIGDWKNHCNQNVLQDGTRQRKITIWFDRSRIQREAAEFDAISRADTIRKVTKYEK